MEHLKKPKQPTKSVLDHLKDAIKKKRIVRFTYPDGTMLLPRDVEPYTVGEARSGKILLRAFQLYGPSKSRHFHAWKLFDVGNMRKFIVLKKTFAKPKDGFKPKQDPVMKEIFEEVSFKKITDGLVKALPANQ